MPGIADADGTNVATVSFNGFVVSLATTAAVHFGDVVDPATGRRLPPNADAGGHMLDLLTVLAEKTRGNLTPDEERFLSRVLQELRMRFAEVRREANRPVSS